MPTPEKYPPCRTCGHSIYQHSSGLCDIKGCECDVYCGSMSDVPVEIYTTSSDMLGWVMFIMVFLLGVMVGVLL